LEQGRKGEVNGDAYETRLVLIIIDARGWGYFILLKFSIIKKKDD
jgi:hypothetical protein